MKNLEGKVLSIMADRKKFDEFVYTPINDVSKELGKRKSDRGKIEKYLKNTLPIGVPTILSGRNYAIVFVQIATPNHELRVFIDMVKSLNGFKPLFFEYWQDKFTDNNEWKYNLGKISLTTGVDKNNNNIVSKFNVVDFNHFKGKRFLEITTLWGQSLVDFHHELFRSAYSPKEFKNIGFYDASEWFSKSGGEPRKYYESFFKLFLLDNILFENYMLNEREWEFTKNIILPALITIRREIGIKPIIVHIQPTDIEGQPFWMHHPQSSIDFMNKKLHSL